MILELIRWNGAGARKLIVVFFLTVFGGFPLYAQDSLAIKGKIVDSQTGAPVPFVTIRFESKQGVFGVISNGEGDFQVPGRYRTMIDTIRISCIGYLSRTMTITQFKDNEVNVVKLKQSVTQLSEVVVNAKKKGRLTGHKIVQAAIDNIPRNYPMSANSYIGYYRDYQRIDNQYVNLNEAIVSVYDEGFQSNDQLNTRIGVYEYKKNEMFQRDSATAVAYDSRSGTKFIPGAELFAFGGNELTILRIHDAIRNRNEFSYSYVNTFDHDFIANHLFKIESVVHLNETPLYHITFRSKTLVTGPDHSANGDLYIDQNSFAIHKFKYTVYGKVNYKTRMLYDIQVEYSKTDSVMRLNYISFNNFFEIPDPKDFKITDILLDRHINAFIIEFNKQPERQSALDAKNYKFKLSDKDMQIGKIEIRKGHENQVYVYISSAIPPMEGVNKLAARLHADIKNIKDLEGREVNKITYIQANQFRELFVQQLTVQSADEHTAFIEKNIPLSKSVITTGVDLSNYWMNTPLKLE